MTWFIIKSQPLYKKNRKTEHLLFNQSKTKRIYQKFLVWSVAKLNRKIIVYLADLANTKFGCSPATVPLAIGYLKAYALEQLGEQAEIRLFRTFEALYAAIQKEEPELIGCSWYGWNRYLTVNALKYIKTRFPDIITVVGGPNAPETKEECLNDFKKFPCFDLIIPNEGEIPFVNLLKIFVQGGKEAVFKTEIDGVFYLSEKGVITGRPVPMTKEINIFPSPYLKGYLDSFLETELMPVIQTSRGCPYQCAFCVSAKHSWKRVRAFDVQRVKEEIDYLEAKAKNKTIRFADENFGLLPGDLEIARFIAEKRAKSSYPDAIRVYTDKHVNNRLKEIILLLKDLIPMNISTQTLTPAVLQNIHRRNLSLEEIKEAVNWAHTHNINATSEFIFGLPGETYQSFMEVIDHFVSLRLDGAAGGTLLMLKETEINTPKIIDQYGYKVLYSVAEGGYTKAGEFESVEIDAWAVENKLFSFKEFIQFHLFNVVYLFFMFVGYFREAVYIWENQGLKVTEVIAELLEQPQRYPLFTQHLERLKKCIMDNLFKTEEEVYQEFIQRFSEKKEHIGLLNPCIFSLILIGEMTGPLNQEKMINEVFAAALEVFKRKKEANFPEFLKETEFAKTLVKKVIVPFWETPEEIVSLLSPYDLVAWRKQDYHGSLSQFRLSQPIEYSFKVQSIDLHRKLAQENADKPLYLQAEAFFRTFRTINIRRYLVL